MVASGDTFTSPWNGRESIPGVWVGAIEIDGLVIDRIETNPTLA